MNGIVTTTGSNKNKFVSFAKKQQTHLEKKLYILLLDEQLHSNWILLLIGVDIIQQLKKMTDQQGLPCSSEVHCELL